MKNPSPKQLKDLGNLLERGQTLLLFTVDSEGQVTIADVFSEKNYELTPEETIPLAIMTYGLQWIASRANVMEYLPLIEEAYKNYEQYMNEQVEELAEKVREGMEKSTKNYGIA